MGDPDSIFSILWSADPATQNALWLVVGATAATFLLIHAPLIYRLVRLFLLERQLSALLAARPLRDDDRGIRGTAAGEAIGDALRDSPVAAQFAEFERRWSTARLEELPDHAPVRLVDVLDDRPLLPFGPRRSLLPVVPGLLLGIGVFGALYGLIPSLSGIAGNATPETTSAWMAVQLGLVLRATAWGFLASITTSFAGRLIEGGFEARGAGLDAIVEHAYGSISPGELAELTRKTQQQSLDTLGAELTKYSSELSERLDRGLQRIEQSTARAASLVSQEQRGALHTVVQELSLSMRQGVEHHLAELRQALQRAVEHQTSVTGSLAETFERLVENSETQDRVARTLGESATSVEKAAAAMSSTAVQMQPVLDHLGTTSQALSETAERISDTQNVVARTAEGVRGSLEYAASGVDDQRAFIERSLSEIRQALVGLGDGLGDSLQRSLREVDDVLGSTVGQLRDTLAESNETIERLSGPIRAAEGSTRETHVALDRVREEVEALGQWMTMAVKPLRSGLGEVEHRAEDITRAITEFSNHTRQIDKSMKALREEIHEESRRLQGTGSELGRRLSQTTEAVGLLETTASDAARRSPTRERSWSRAPSEPRPMRTEEGTEEIARESGRSRFDRPPRSLRDESIEDEPAPSTVPGVERRDDQEESSPSRDLARSGYRLGTPRAVGPDPYSRLEAKETSKTSNVRHFPTRDRELADDLKLSSLLGAPGEDDDDAADGSAPDAEDEA